MREPVVVVARGFDGLVGGLLLVVAAEGAKGSWVKEEEVAVGFQAGVRLEVVLPYGLTVREPSA